MAELQSQILNNVTLTTRVSDTEQITRFVDDSIREAGVDPAILSDYYTKEETDEAIADVIKGIDFPEQKTSTIPQKGVNYAPTWQIYDPNGNILSGLYEVKLGDMDFELVYHTYVDNIHQGTFILNNPSNYPLIAHTKDVFYIDKETFNFPDTIIKFVGPQVEYDARNEIQHSGYTTVDGFVWNYTSKTNSLVIENVRGFLAPEAIPQRVNRQQLMVKNCGILGESTQFLGVQHLTIAGDVNYFSTLMFTFWVDYEDTFCQHITFIGNGILKSKIFRFPNLLSYLDYWPAPSTRPLTIEFPDITFNEFTDWCNANAIYTPNIYEDFFNSSAIAKLVFKDQTITDVTQEKLDAAEPDLIATLADGTILPCRNSDEASEWHEAIGDAVKLEIFNTNGYPSFFGEIDCFSTCTALKEVIDHRIRTSGTDYVYPIKLDSLTVGRYSGLEGNNAENAYITRMDPGTGYTLFQEDRVIQNVYFTNIEDPSNVEEYLGNQNADAKIYFAGVLAAVYSGVQHELTWKNGFEPNIDS